MLRQLGQASYAQFSAALQETPPVSVRLNPRKAVADLFSSAAPVPWSAHGRYLPERPLFAADPLIFAGAYYVQEPSSMFLSAILRQLLPPNEPLKVLDFCAAPGGKTTLLLSMLSPESLLVANELMRNRLPALSENLTRWGAHNTIVTSADAAHFQQLPAFFDLILVDAPCSGEGMFRKDSKAINMWSENLVRSCAGTQRKILDQIMPALKPGGLLIYSTCTFSEAENEKNLIHLAESNHFEPIKIDILPPWGILQTEVRLGEEVFYGYRFYPHRLKGEGFFICCLRKKKGAAVSARFKKKKKKSADSPLHFLSEKAQIPLKPWLKSSAELVFLSEGAQLAAFPQHQRKALDYFSRTFPAYRKIGVSIGKIQRNTFTPSHALALSRLCAEHIPRYALDYSQAIAYLRKDPLTLKTTTKKGWALVCYKKIILGWIKILPGRINNYYPTQMRLRKKIPDTPKNN